MPKKKSIGKKLRKFSIETRYKSANEFKDKVLSMFKGYIKAIIVWGSITRGDFTGKSDVDIYIIFDDTKIPLKKFEEIRPKINRDIYRLAKETDPRLHPQPVIALTDFYQNVRMNNPFIYNIVREGFAVYDVGFFIPMRKLLEKGVFPVTKEAADIRMDTVPRRIERVKHVKLLMVVDDLYQAMVDSAQAALMYLGLAPPAPKLLAKQMREHLVDNKLTEEKYVKYWEEMLKLRKGSEKKEVNTLTGQQVDDWIKKSEEFVKEMEKVISKIELSRKISNVKKNYEVTIKATVAALKKLNKLPKDPKKLPKAFKEHLIDTGLVSPLYQEVFGKVLEMRKKLEERKLHEVKEREIQITNEYVRRFLSEVKPIIQGLVEYPKKEEKTTEKKSKAKKKKTVKKEKSTKDEAKSKKKTSKSSKK
ncbi:MAG: nucleotidyltransferase domain-containing protein [Candidatus Aenigmarchaeota archaeon]|nr:nucleotidyltransferase domain-containing protein [Candidatus Aenigmarchaeota archaeon]